MSRAPRCLGVLGGMGPLAGAHFAVRVAELTPVTRDQDHIPLLLRNDPRIPDPSTAWMNGDASPLPAMMRGIAMQQDAGADCIALPCNTAHLWFDQLQAATSARLLHIVQAVVLDLQRQGVRAGSVGVLGTRATLKTGLYQRYLAAHGYETTVPTTCWRTATARLPPSRATVKVRRSRRWLVPSQRDGARAVVLGCTELPLALPASRRGEFGVVITDSIDDWPVRPCINSTPVANPTERHSMSLSIQPGRCFAVAASKVAAGASPFGIAPALIGRARVGAPAKVLIST